MGQEDPVIYEIPFKLQKEIKNSDGSIFFLTEGRLLNAVSNGNLSLFLQKAKTYLPF